MQMLTTLAVWHGQNVAKTCKSLSPNHFQIGDFKREFGIFICTSVDHSVD